VARRIARSEPGKPCTDPRSSWWRHLQRFINLINTLITSGVREEAGSDRFRCCQYQLEVFLDFPPSGVDILAFQRKTMEIAPLNFLKTI
jgi:hypothetical protein